jgi:hypothetical protein
VRTDKGEWKDDPVSDVLLEEVKEYNAYIKTEIPTMKFSNIRVKIVDQYTVPNGKLNDGLHPNMEGFIGMAKSGTMPLQSPTAMLVMVRTRHATGSISGRHRVMDHVRFW